MRIDLPCCGFKNCRYCFDGNCTKPSKLEKCEYWYLLHEEPEIITCKDCIKREYCRTSTVWAVAPGDEWFCADAERKE